MQGSSIDEGTKWSSNTLSQIRNSIFQIHRNCQESIIKSSTLGCYPTLYPTEMYLQLTLMALAVVNWTNALPGKRSDLSFRTEDALTLKPLPVPDNGQAAVAVPTPPTPTTVIRSFENSQLEYAPFETHQPTLDGLAESAADVLKERASGPGTSFDSLLCATLKALKGENPATFTSLLQSCTSLIDSTSHGRMKALKERNDVAVDVVEAVDNEFGTANLDRTETALREKRGVFTKNIMVKRNENLDNLRAPL